ncbi:AAA family ATPase [Desulfonema magnum]|uniref:AAA family ATPase n=1 Tax=Desulfonema magnum TaxID=45655 RepID=A0A975GS94_9BACT|nr:AAA family ATPase [Desulfonema magnum]QTA91826.1 AAA family ATPase [Desulfonema magnum]
MNTSLMLSKLILKNFKNIKIENHLPLNNLNVLIGPNGSGKSNLIALLKFMRNCLISNSDEGRGVTDFEEAVIELGDHKILDATVQAPATVSFEFEFNAVEVIRREIKLELDIMLKGANTNPIVRREILCDSQPALGETSPFCYYKAHEPESGAGVVTIYNDADRRSSRFEKLHDVPVNRLTLSSIPELLEFSLFSPEDTPVYKVRRQMTDIISGWRFYNANDMNLKDIRNSEPKIGPADIFLSSSGENLPLVLDNLTQKDFDFDERINDAMKNILPLTRKIRAVRSGRLRLTVEWYMEGMNECFYLNDISDGSVRMLCWAIVLHSPVLPSLLVMDEPETGLHPSWMKTLAEWIKTASERTQIIIATHSPDLLDHFTDRYKDVLCFEYDGKKHFVPRRLPEEELKVKIEEGWELGDLYRVGDHAVGGWPW